MEIKVCKCGCTPEVVKIFPKNRPDCFIRCPECGSETKCYTSRQNAVKAWNEWKLSCDPIKDMEGVILRIFDEDYTEGFEPTADRTAEELFIAGYRKQHTAKWIYDPNGTDWGLGAWVCSECNVKNDNLGMSENINPYLFAGSKWCPNCGAKMKANT